MARKSTRKKAAAPAGDQDRSSALPAWMTAPFMKWGADRGWGRWLLISGLLWLLLAMLYPGPVFHGEIFGSADAGNAEAFEQVGDRVLADGQYPLWNPYLFAGMPTFGSLSYVKYLYPPTTVFNFLQNKVGFGPLTWMLTHLLWGGLGMAWLLSRWKLPVGYLVLGAVVWLLFPKVVAWGVHGHGSKLITAMYLPWVVGWALKIFDGGGRRAVGMTGLLLGLQILSGHPQIIYYTLLVTGWLGLWNTFRPFDAHLRSLAAGVRARRLGLMVLGIGLGFLVGGILLVSVHDYAGISIRGQDTAGGGGVGLDYATGWSLAPREMGTFILPAAAGFGKATYLGHMAIVDYPNYFGVMLLLLAVAAWSRGGRSLTAALGVMSLLAILVSLGKFGFGFYEWLYGWLPFFNKFRIPSMILITVAFAVAVLAARGGASWREEPATFFPPVFLPGVLGLVGLVFLLGGAASLFQGSYQAGLAALAAEAGRQAPGILLQKAWQLHQADLIRIGLILMTCGAAFWYSLRNDSFRRHGLVWVLVLLVVVDYMGVNRRIVHPERSLHEVGVDAAGRGRLVTAATMGRPYVRRDQIPADPAAEILHEAVGHDRVWPLGRLGAQNIWMVSEIRSLGGYHPAKLARYEPIRRRLFSEEPAGRLASWLAGSVVAFGGPFGEAEFSTLAAHGCDLDPEPVHQGRTWLYRNRGALPRARLVTAWQPVSSLPEKDALEPFLDGIQAGTIPVADVVYLDETPDPAPESAATALPSPVFTLDSLNEVVLETESPVPALLLLSDMMAPGWRVQVDGRDAELLEADLVLRAVALEAGHHTVRFHFGDSSVRTGLTLSLSGVILVILLLIPLGRFRSGAKTGERTIDE
ncbi:MAG: hypothetical protein ABFS42_08755 [Candidatus Krumholzibacteriota bacterium]